MVEGREVTFLQVGDIPLPEEAKEMELHFFVGRNRVEIWLMPPSPPPEALDAWLQERSHVAEARVS